MKWLITLLIFIVNFSPSFSQINAKLMRYMDVSDTQIAFVYGGDIWTVAKEGGMAVQLTRSPGEESWPRFSPDGKSLAFTASYNGSQDIYVMPSQGGVPIRVTYRSFPDRMIDWHPDGERLLFASPGEQGGRRLLNQFFLVDKSGGLPEKLPLPYGELGSFSPDGRQLAYITKITENYPFKRIRSGANSDILIYDLNSNQVENITKRIAIDGKPAWAGNTVYFLSDENDDMRLNIWAYDTEAKTMEQLTDFKDFDISYLSASEKDLVFEVGGDLYLMDLTSKTHKKIDVHIVSDFSLEMPQQKDVSKSISNMTLSPDGKRVVFEARGELFNVPSKEGFTQNLTGSSGVFDHNPAWSPDGKSIAYWSDQSGEYEIWIQNIQGNQEPKKLSSRGKGFGYTLHWSPDSKRLAFIDEKNDISVIEVASGKIQKAGNSYWYISHSIKSAFSIGWSPDSRWITFIQGLENANTAVFLFNVDTDKLHQATSGFYSDSYPLFSKDGKYLFFQTKRNMEAVYSALDDGTWVYPNATQIGVIALGKSVSSFLPPKNDTLSIEMDKKLAERHEEKKPDDAPVNIDFEDMESRMEMFPIKAGNIGIMTAIADKLIYLRFPRTGSGDNSSSLVYYDYKERKEKTIAEKVDNYVVSADGKSVLIVSNGHYGVIEPKENQKIEQPVPTNGMVMKWVAKEEWHQIFNDTWRRYRDFFYDADMHQVVWEDMRKRYGTLVQDARTRWDIINIQLNMISELAAGHTYVRTGDTETVTPRHTGFLGIEWEKEGERYRIKRIIKPAPWDTEVRSPFDRPGMGVNEGDYVLAVNGIKLDPNKDPYAAFEGLGGNTVSITIGKGLNGERKEIVLTCLSPAEESNLKYLEWIEKNRKLVENLSEGKLGYVYMSNTGDDGQKELVSMYYGQLDKKGFIIDERFNGGGRLAARFLELMKRPVVSNHHYRQGRDHTYPIKTNTGPMGMLINGWAASGGDALPWAFKELKAGPIVGENTLGVLVVGATPHTLIDGGVITVPAARLYDNAGHWFWEGEGVSPDIVVWDDPNLMMQGRDPQIERVVEEVLKLLESNPSKFTPAPPYEDRTAKGLKRD